MKRTSQTSDRWLAVQLQMGRLEAVSERLLQATAGTPKEQNRQKWIVDHDCLDLTHLFPPNKKSRARQPLRNALDLTSIVDDASAPHGPLIRSRRLALSAGVLI